MRHCSFIGRLAETTLPRRSWISPRTTQDTVKSIVTAVLDRVQKVKRFPPSQFHNIFPSTWKMYPCNNASHANVTQIDLDNFVSVANLSKNGIV
jgi:hypothetical protein